MFPFSSPPAARCRGDAPAALLLPAPTDPLDARAACVVASGAPEGAVRRVQMAWAWPGELGHGLGSLGIAWRGWVWPGELRHGLGSSGITWRAWASPGELRHCLGSSGITWRAPASPGAPQAGGAMLRALAQMPLAEVGGTACPGHPSSSASQPRANKVQTLPKEHPPEPSCHPQIPQSLERHPGTSPGLGGPRTGSFARRGRSQRASSAYKGPQKPPGPREQLLGLGAPTAEGSPPARETLSPALVGLKALRASARPARGVGGEGGRGCGQGPGR